MSIFDDLEKEKRNQGINSLASKLPSQYDYSQYSMAANPNPATGGRDIYKGGIRQSHEQMLPSFQAGFDTQNIKNVYQEPQLPPAPIPQAPAIPETPAIPEPPKVDYLSELQKRILASLTPTSEESTLATQYADTDKQLADLIASKELGISGLEGQGRGIPLSLIRGQQGKLAEQAGLQALPLQAQLANIQAKRNIEADKRKAAMDVATTQMSYEEKRQEREEKLKEAEAKKLEGFNLSEGQVRYAYDPTTKSYKKVAGIEKPQSITEKYGTGTVGEYNYYAEQEKMAGKTPMSFNEYQTADANRKARIAGASSDLSGMPNSYKEWSIAGGLDGTGKTYAQWANPEKATVGTQAQQTVAEYAARIEQAEPTINFLEKNIQGMNIANFKVQLSLPSALQSTEMQQYMQAASNFINAKLRKESGAVIATSEFEEARRQYLPQPGDSDETLKLKKQNRDLVYGSMKKAAGPAFSSVNELLNEDKQSQVQEIINQNPNEWGKAADAIDAKFGKGTATKYDYLLQKMYNPNIKNSGKTSSGINYIIEK